MARPKAKDTLERQELQVYSYQKKYLQQLSNIAAWIREAIDEKAQREKLK